MDSTSFNRKLAAILYADIAGYSRLSGEDEDGTHSLLREYLDAAAAVINGHRGRVVHYAGDAVLADFSTVSDALNCAAAIQFDLKTRNEVLPDGGKVQFRIGVNLGEVIVDRDDIYGDGVNIAARLESLAEPGGICISESARSAVGKKLPFAYQDMGEQRVKNIAEPVRAYRVLLDASVADAAASPEPKAIPHFNRWLVIVVSTFFILIMVAAIGYLQPWEQIVEPTAEKIETTERSKYIAPAENKLSIAVLPFANMSTDLEQEYFADGMTEDLITDLSKISSLTVIARNSVFAYKGTTIKVQQIGRELGVRYLLEGSVRKAGDQVRINAQLLDASTGGHLWAERYDRQLQNIFALQDEITGQIITALAVKLTESERNRLAHQYTNDVAAYDYFLRAQERLFHYMEDTYEQARVLYRKAIELDPTFARAYSALAVTYVNELMVGYGDQTEESLLLALELSNTALRLDDSLPQAYFAQGYVLLFKRQHKEAVAALQTALVLDPNYADGYLLLAFIHIHTADGAGDAFEAILRGMQLNPNYSLEYLGILAQAYYWAGEYEKAAEAFLQALERNPAFLLYRCYLISTYIRLKQEPDAEWEAEEVLALNPDFSLANWAQQRPFEDPEQITLLLNDLRRAGLPE